MLNSSRINSSRINPSINSNPINPSDASRVYDLSPNNLLKLTRGDILEKLDICFKNIPDSCEITSSFIQNAISECLNIPVSSIKAGVTFKNIQVTKEGNLFTVSIENITKGANGDKYGNPYPFYLGCRDHIIYLELINNKWLQVNHSFSAIEPDREAERESAYLKSDRKSVYYDYSVFTTIDECVSRINKDLKPYDIELNRSFFCTILGEEKTDYTEKRFARDLHFLMREDSNNRSVLITALICLCKGHGFKIEDISTMLARGGIGFAIVAELERLRSSLKEDRLQPFINMGFTLQDIAAILTPRLRPMISYAIDKLCRAKREIQKLRRMGFSPVEIASMFSGFDVEIIWTIRDSIRGLIKLEKYGIERKVIMRNFIKLATEIGMMEIEKIAKDLKGLFNLGYDAGKITELLEGEAKYLRDEIKSLRNLKHNTTTTTTTTPTPTGIIPRLTPIGYLPTMVSDFSLRVGSLNDKHGSFLPPEISVEKNSNNMSVNFDQYTRPYNCDGEQLSNFYLPADSNDSILNYHYVNSDISKENFLDNQGVSHELSNTQRGEIINEFKIEMYVEMVNRELSSSGIHIDQWFFVHIFSTKNFNNFAQEEIHELTKMNDGRPSQLSKFLVYLYRKYKILPEYVASMLAGSDLDIERALNRLSLNASQLKDFEDIGFKISEVGDMFYGAGVKITKVIDNFINSLADLDTYFFKPKIFSPSDIACILRRKLLQTHSEISQLIMSLKTLIIDLRCKPAVIKNLLGKCTDKNSMDVKIKELIRLKQNITPQFLPSSPHYLSPPNLGDEQAQKRQKLNNS